ncbi:MAG: hypothetical protein PHD20_02830 [Clostridia bacterium]|nr:hypothetical protein [Clostridia bacterium]
MERTIQELASEALTYFTTGTRDNGNKYIKTTDNRPEWVHDMVFTAHDNGNILPDDWKYKFIEESLYYISEHEEVDFPEEMEADIYTSDLTEWLHSRNDRIYYMSEVLEEYDHIKDGFQLLQISQTKEKEEVYFSVLNSLQEIIDNQENDEEEENEED